MGRLAPYLAAAALAAALFFALRGRAPVVPTSPSTRPNAPAHAPSARPAAPEPRAQEALESLPPALRDTEVDGELPTDSHGELVVGPAVRQFFDWFLVASTELPPESLRALAAAEIERRLAPPASARALALFDRYLEYRRRAAELDSGGTDYEARLAALRHLRREVIGPRDAAALFADEEEAALAALERQRIAEDPRLTPEQRERALAEAESRLPESERETRARTRSAVRLLEAERELRARGGSAGEIRALREASVGPEAADRLEALDRDEARFQASLERLRAEQRALAADPKLSDEARAAALAQRIDALVPEVERIRARSLLGLL